MRKIWILSFCLVALAACEKGAPSPAAPGPGTETASTPDVPAGVEQAAPPARPVAGALKSDLPEGFLLPFAFYRLYDNTGKTETGKLQRRILVEFLDQDGPAVAAALGNALELKGFSAPTSDTDDGITRLEFKRTDGASVVVKIDPKRETPRATGAKGTLHLTWNEG